MRRKAPSGVQPKQYANVKIAQVGVVIVHVHFARPEDDHKEEGAQFDEEEEEIDELLSWLLKKEAAVEQVAEGDYLNTKQNSQQEAPEVVQGANFGALVGVMRLNWVKSRVVSMEDQADRLVCHVWGVWAHFRGYSGKFYSLNQFVLQP